MRGCSKVIIILFVGILSSSLYGHSGGSGTVDDPYRIASAQDLIALGDTSSDYDKHFVLTADIDLSGYLFDQAVIAPHSGNNTPSFEGPNFCGSFDGGGHVIANLRIQGGRFLGLFGRLNGPGAIRHLGLVDVEIDGDDVYIGALVGENGFGSIISCYSTGTVHGEDRVGGLVGENWGGSIAGSYSACTVEGKEDIGGLVGNNLSNISHCYSTGIVSGKRYVGGLVGSDGRGSISCSYSTGAVSGIEDIGGLTGYDGSAGVVASFWDVSTSGRAQSASGVGLATAQMQTIDTYLGAGWDFEGESANGTSQWWAMPAEGGYPILRAIEEGPSITLSGEGTASSPYRITNELELGVVCHHSPRAHFELAADVDLSGIVWRHAVIPSFSGVLNGNGHTIRHLTISGSGDLGLCGMLFGGTIHDVELSEVHVAGNGSCIGSLVGTNDGSVTGCRSSGEVSGVDDVGGLAGMNLGDNSRVTACCHAGTVEGNLRVGGLVGRNFYGSVGTSYSAGEVSGSRYVGGLAGTNVHDSIQDSYSTASADGEIAVGGLVGYNYYGSIISSYSTGTVSGDESVGGFVGQIGYRSRTRGFWDVERSGMVSSSGGAGLTSAEMMDAQWVGLNGLANNPAWVLDRGRDYPRLGWEGTSGQAVAAPSVGWLAGKGTADDPYQIENVDQLTQIGKASLLWDEHLALTDDLDLLGTTWPQAVIPCFGGTFLGNGHLIKNLRIDGANYLGLFGRIDRGATIDSVGLENVSVTGSGYGVGGLAGYSNGRVVESYVTGSVGGGEAVGGLVGYNGYEGGVFNSYSTVVVSGDRRVGGLVGYNYYSSIADSFSAGAVEGDILTGGLVGESQSGSTTDSFWDVDASGQTGSDGGTGLSTTKMRDVSTFLDAGWDFVGEAANGSEDIWKMPPVFSSYPRLAWGGYIRATSVEDFESGEFSRFDWEHAGDADWSICLAGHGGRLAAGSGSIGDEERSILRLTLDCVAGELRFFVKVSSESFCDLLAFRIDGQQVGQWSGEVDWTEVSYSLEAGSHVFEWEYSKDYSASEGDDMAWIDDVSFPLP